MLRFRLAAPHFLTTSFIDDVLACTVEGMQSPSFSTHVGSPTLRVIVLVRPYHPILDLLTVAMSISYYHYRRRAAASLYEVVLLCILLTPPSGSTNMWGGDLCPALCPQRSYPAVCRSDNKLPFLLSRPPFVYTPRNQGSFHSSTGLNSVPACVSFFLASWTQCVNQWSFSELPAISR